MIFDFFSHELGLADDTEVNNVVILRMRESKKSAIFENILYLLSSILLYCELTTEIYEDCLQQECKLNVKDDFATRKNSWTKADHSHAPVTSELNLFVYSRFLFSIVFNFA